MQLQNGLRRFPPGANGLRFAPRNSVRCSNLAVCRLFIVIFLKIFIFSTWAGCGSGIEILGASQQQSAIVSGQEDSGHPAVGFLLAQKSGGLGICTGTLIGTQTVLTAAHCLDEIISAKFRLGSTDYVVSKGVQHSQYSSSVINAYDLGLVVLSSKVSGVMPAPLAKAPPQAGQLITVVGYGVTGTDQTNYGTKRVTQNLIASVKNQYFRYDGSSNGAGNTCQGDSGGPSFRLIDDEEVLIGVHATASVPCGIAGNDMRVDVFYQWIESQAAGDLGADTKPPTVTIIEPASGVTVSSSFTVKVTATDDGSGVDSVSMLVDGTLHKTSSVSPAEFNLSDLQPGQHTLRSEARDGSGNLGFTQITVNVQASSPPSSTSPTGDTSNGSGAGPAPAPGEFGSNCENPGDCNTHLCAADSLSGTTYCTRTCDPQNPCPAGTDCLPSGDTQVCAAGLNGFGPNESDVLRGGCSMGRTTSGSLWLLMVMIVLLSFSLRSR